MGTSSRTGAVLAVLVAMAVLMAFACVLAAFAPIGDARLDYWLAVFSGNWSVRTFGPEASFGEFWEYWVGVLFALSFNIGTILAVVSSVITLVLRETELCDESYASLRCAEGGHRK